MPYISFQELKERVPLMEVVRWLGIEMKQHKDQFRSSCPICEKDDPRVFVVTPAKKAWYCFNCQDGGDCIKLVANFHRIGTKEAAERINAAFPGTVKSTASAERTVPTSPKRQQSGELKPLEHLAFEHEALDALGLSKGVSEALGVGVPTKGVIRNRLAIPIRLPDGRLIGYFGMALDPEQMPLLWVPQNLEEMVTAKPKQPAEECEPPTDVRKFLRLVK